MTQPEQYYQEIDLESIEGTDRYVCVTPSGATSRALGGLSRVNLFVGANNSGKSRLLRAMHRSRGWRFVPLGADLNAINGALKELDTTLRAHLAGNIVGYGPIGQDAGNYLAPFLDMRWFGEANRSLRDAQTKVRALESTTAFSPTTRGGTSGATVDQVRTLHEKQIKPQALRVASILEAYSDNGSNEDKVYIPVLRGLRPLPGSTGDPYLARTQKDYNIPGNRRDLVFTGLSMYDEIKGLLLSNRTDRDRVRRYEDFLGTHVFDGKAVNLVPHKDQDVVLLGLADDERPIYDYGDGVQSLIALTFLPFTATAPMLFFIEEPETHLHPGMQRKILELFLGNDGLSRHQYFVTTHSNHLVDMAADYDRCSTLLFRRTGGDFEIRTVEPAQRLVLGELGVRASSVFLTNATVWVEGITDRLFFREFLKRYFESVSGAGGWVPREDTHYSFLEGGGACIGHFSFTNEGDIQQLTEKIKVARVCSNSMVILDGDTEGKPRWKELKEALDDNLIVLEGKEVEHLLPVDILREFILKYDGSANVSQLQLADYAKTREPLGEIIEAIVGTSVLREGATVKHKSNLMDFAVEFMRSRPKDWDLTPESRDICERIYTFVRQSNGR